MKLSQRKWKKLLLWVAGYVNVLALVLIGGYFMCKDEDKKVKCTAKCVCLTYIVFLAMGAVLSIVSYIGGAFDWYGSWVQKAYNACSVLVNVGRIVTFAVCALVAVFKKEECACCCKQEETPEANEEKTEE